MTSLTGRLWLFYLLAGTAGAFAASFVPAWLVTGVTVAQITAPLVVVAGIVWRRPARPALWWLAAGGLALAQAWWRLGWGMVARLGGDEFAVVLPPLTGPEAREVAAALVRVAALPREVAGHPVTVSASAGLLDLDRVASAAAALHDADVALYAAKAAGRSCYRMHAPETDRGRTRAATGAG